MCLRSTVCLQGVLKFVYLQITWFARCAFACVVCDVWLCQVSVRSSADVQAQPEHIHDKSNLLYVGNSMKICRAAFEKHQSLGLVLDEARTPTANVLQTFLATPIAYDVAQGFCCPPQIMPDMHVCFGSKSLAVRISEVTTSAASGTKMSGKPSADPLVFTYNTIKAIDNAVQCLLPDDGLMRFMPEDRMVPVGEGERCLLYDIGGRKRWMKEDSSQEQSPVLPGAHVLTLPLELAPPCCRTPLHTLSCSQVIVVVVAFYILVVICFVIPV